MNSNTGAVYASYDNAIAAGEKPEVLVTGPKAAIQKLSQMVVARNTRNAKRKIRRQIAAASRKRNCRS